MPSEKKVDFKTYRQALDVFKQGELNKQTSVADKYKNAAALMKVAGKYLTDRGVDITKPFETEEILKGWENRGPGRDHLEEVANAFKLSKQRVDEIRQKVREAKRGAAPNQQAPANMNRPVEPPAANKKVVLKKAAPKQEVKQAPANMNRPVEPPVANKKTAPEKVVNMSRPEDRGGAERKEWYNNVFKTGLRRSGGGDEINENNPLDWSRLRVLKDGKLVPFMGEAQFGVPNDLQLELLQNEAKNGNLFFYRLGEEYPQHLVDGVWQSIDPAIGDKRPELKLPEPPKKPEPYTGTLEDELKARNLSPLLVNITSVQQIPDENARIRYTEAREAWRHKDAVSLREQKQYQQDLQQYEKERARLTKEYETNIQDWQKKLDAYNKLGLNIKQAINDEAPQRKVTILRNQETRRADEMDARPLVDWYHNEFRKSMVRPSGAADLVESDGMDWGRVRIWDGEKFARALPEGHRGMPDAKALKNLRDAAQSGNLFMYQRGDKYPSKWTGRDWTSMDKGWIDQCKPKEVENLGDRPDKPFNRAGEEPKLEDYTKNISSVKLGFNKVFFFAFRAEARKYRDAQSNYEESKKRYKDDVADYEQQMEAYTGKPVNRAGEKPLVKDFTKDISSVKLGINKILPFAFKSASKDYVEAVVKYEKAKNKYEKDTVDYERKLKAYNEKKALYDQDYDNRQRAYEYMLKNYEGLTAKQKAAMEKDATLRAEEIKRNKETQVRKAEDNLVKEQNAQNMVNDSEKRVNAVKPRPLMEQFLNPVGTVQQPLGQNAYDIIAPNGYDLPANSMITPEDAAAIHVALAGSAQAAMNGGLSPLSAGQYGQMLDGVLYGRPSETDLNYITASYGAAKEFITAYEGGNPKPLADALSTGLRNLIAVGSNRLDLTPEMAGLAKLTGRILDVMDRTPGLLENCSLSKEEMNLARGMVNLGRIYNNALAAKMDLMRQYTGAQQLTSQQMQMHAANLLIAQTTGSVLKEGNQEAQYLVGLYGAGQGNALNTVQNVYRNNEAIQMFANNPQNLNATDLDKGMQNLANAVSKSTLAKPRESAQLREEIRNQVKEQMEQNSPQARELRNREVQLEVLERQQVRYVLAQHNPQYETLSLQDPVITEKLNDLRKAREILEARDNQRYEKLTFRKKDMETNESLRGYADREEYKDLKPDDLIEIDGSVANKRYELTDEAVLKEAAERAGIRALMQEENAQRRKEGKSELAINDFNLDRRMKELRIAQQQLTTDEKTPELTDPSVIAKAIENRDARAQRFKGTIKELLQAQDVYTRERGLQVDDNGRWPTQKVQEKDFGRALEGAKAGLKKQGAGEPFYRSEEVQKRLEELRKAREELGPEYANLPLNDNKVIKKQYELSNIDPARFGIQEPDTMTTEQRKAYDERMQVVEYLRTVEGKDLNIHQRDHIDVDVKIKDLKYNRQMYEGISGAAKDLPLNDPRILAASIARQTCIAENKPMNYTAQEIEALGEQIKGKPETQAKQIVQQHILNPQPQIQQVQPQLQG